MKAIGFAEKFYTLWDIRIDNNHITDVHGNHHLSHTTTYYTYIKNISMERDKVIELYPNLSIDENLRGKSRDWFVKSEDLAPHILKFGKYRGTSVQEVAAKDFPYLLWLAENANHGIRTIIDELPEYIAHVEKIKAERIAKENSYVRLDSGVHEVTFTYNPHAIDISESRLPEIDELLAKTPNGYLAQSDINENTRLYVIFPIGKHVNSLYPYNMVEIHGKMVKTKNKTFSLNLNIELTFSSEYGVTQYATIQNH
jgi:hypothetical protein